MQDPERIRARTWALPAAVLIFTLLTTLAAAGATQSAIQERERGRFESEVAKLDDALLDRLATYEQVLLGARGLMEASEEVQRDEWRVYVDSLELAERFPGIQGVGWSLVIAPENLTAHIQEVRAEGFPEYTVWPEGARDTYTSIVYLEPFRDRNLRAFGFDMFSQPVRNEAMQRARDTGAAALSGTVRLVQETEEDVQPGFLMYLPVYRGPTEPTTVEERKTALLGYVYSPFRAGDFMTGMLGPGAPDIEFAVYDSATASPASRLHITVNPDDFEPRLERHLTIAGRTWTIQYAMPQPFFETTLLPLIVLGGGVAISGLLFGLTLSATTRKEGAIRLAERMTDELRRSREALQRSNQELERFAYVASHDLREPLRSVSGFIDLLRHHSKERLDETSRQYIEFALQGTRRMHRLVDGLLEYSRINGRQPDPAYVELNEAWDEAVFALSAQVQETNSVVTRDSLPRAFGHRDQFVRLFQNLISNAIKYRGASAARVHCSATVAEGECTIRVQDQGIGIHPQFQKQLFILFRRLHAQHQIEGTGVGLAVCKRIVEIHGGRMWVESEEGKGATFIFTLPLGRPPPAIEDPDP